MKWVLLILVALVALVALIVVVALVGLLLPKAHVASRTVRLRRPIADVWSAMCDFAAQPAWRSDVTRVERLANQDSREVWVEIRKDKSRLPLETLESSAPSRLVRRIADPKVPFGGTWTHDLLQDGEYCRVTITENGEIYNPIFRVMARLFFGYHSTIDAYLRALGRRFGEDVTPV